MVINRKNVTKTAILIFIVVFYRHVIILLFSSFRNKHTNSLIKQAQYSASQQLQRWCICFSFYLQWQLVVSRVQKRQMYSKSSQLPKEKLKTMIMQNFVGTTKISFSNMPGAGSPRMSHEYSLTKAPSRTRLYCNRLRLSHPAWITGSLKCFEIIARSTYVEQQGRRRIEETALTPVSYCLYLFWQRRGH